MNEKLGKIQYELDLDAIDTILGYGTSHECADYLSMLFDKALQKKKDEEIHERK